MTVIGNGLGEYGIVEESERGPRKTMGKRAKYKSFLS